MKRSLVLVPLLLAAVAFSYFLAPVALAILWMAVAIKPLGEARRPGLRPFGAAAAAILCATVLFLGFLSVVHALFLLGLAAFGPPDLHPLGSSWWNLALAVPGLVLGFLGARMIVALAYELRKLVRLSPTPVADVRLGLHEIRGTARAIPGTVPLIDARGAEAAFPDPPADALLHFVREERGQARAERGTMRRFAVEDETGRLLVDPEGVRPWRGAESPFWERFSKALLTARVGREDLPGGGFRETRSLKDGDPVHLVGWVDRNPNASNEEEGPGRFLLRLSDEARRCGRALPVSGQRWDVANLVPRCREAAIHALRGESPRDVFLLSDAEEIRIRGHFIRAIRRASLPTAVWILLPLWLIKDTVVHAPYRDWRPAEIAAHAPPPERREALDRAARSEQPARRAEAVTAIGRGASADPAAMRRIAESLGDPDPRVRQAALTQLRAHPIRPISPDVRDRLVELLRTGDPEVAADVLFLLPNLGAPPVTLLPALESAFGRARGRTALQLRIAEALAREVERDRERSERVVSLVLPVLLETLSPARATSTYSFQARNVLHRLAQSDSRSVGIHLARALATQPTAAAQALSSLGPAAREARPALEETADRHESPQVRLLALRALRSVDSSGCGPAALRRLADPSPEVRREALELLAASPPTTVDADAAVRLGTLAAAPSAIERNIAQGILRYDGARDAAPAIVAELRAGRETAVWQSVRAILRRAGDAAVEPLAAATRDDSALTRRNAAETLGYFGPAALPALQGLSNDPDPQVRWAAEAAIVRAAPSPDAPAPRPEPVARPSVPAPARARVPSSRPWISPPVVVTATRLPSRYIHRGWMPRAPLVREPQVIPIVTKSDWASACRVLGIPEEKARSLESLQGDLVFFLVTAGAKQTRGASIYVTEMRRLPDGSGLVVRIYEDEEPRASMPTATEYPYVLVGLPVKDVLPVDSCVDRRYEAWPARIHATYRNP